MITYHYRPKIREEYRYLAKEDLHLYVVVLYDKGNELQFHRTFSRRQRHVRRTYDEIEAMGRKELANRKEIA